MIYTNYNSYSCLTVVNLLYGEVNVFKGSWLINEATGYN